MVQQAYTLQPIARIAWGKRLTIIMVVLATMAVGLAISLLRPKAYKAKVEFFLKNPLYADRSYLYSSDARMIDYFAGDEDIDRMRSMIWADSVQDKIIREMHLAEAYGRDMAKPADAKAMKKEFSGRMNIYRTESKVAILSYVDKDEERAAAVASRSVQLLEQLLRGFYNEMRQSIYVTMAGRISEEDSMIGLLTDALAVLREQYGISFQHSGIRSLEFT